MGAQDDKTMYAINEKLLVLNAGLRVIDASPAFYKAFDLGPAETLGRLLGELANGPWNAPALLKRLSEITLDGRDLDAFEVQYDFPTLGLRTMVLSGRRLPNDGNGSGAILLGIEDVTNQRNADAVLAQQRAWFETALSGISDAVIACDVEGHVTFMNPTAEKLTGWTQKDALGMPLAEVFNIVDEHLHGPVEGPVPRAIRAGTVTGLAGLTTLLSRNGTQRPIDDSATPIRDDTGKILGVVIHFRTITNRQRTARRLEVSEVRYRRLFETAHDGILILDALTGRVLDVNRFLLDLLQYPVEHFLGKELWEIGVFHDAQASKAAMAALQERGSIRYEDLPLEAKDGRRIPVEFVSNVYREGDHNVIQCNIRDITERRTRAK
jgi:PAS domain S-box-containing protein